MRIPGFNAEISISYGSGSYRNQLTIRQGSGPITPAVLNQNCYGACYGDCLHECFALPGWSKSACVRDCRERSQECQEACRCTPSTTCYPDGSDPRCQICYQDHCDGTASVWHTC